MLPNTNCRLKRGRIYGEGQGGLFIIYEVLNGCAAGPPLALADGRAGSADPDSPPPPPPRARSDRVCPSHDTHANGRKESELFSEASGNLSPKVRESRFVPSELLHPIREGRLRATAPRGSPQPRTSLEPPCGRRLMSAGLDTV